MLRNLQPLIEMPFPVPSLFDNCHVSIFVRWLRKSNVARLNCKMRYSRNNNTFRGMHILIIFEPWISNSHYVSRVKEMNVNRNSNEKGLQQIICWYKDTRGFTLCRASLLTIPYNNIICRLISIIKLHILDWIWR